MKTLTIDLKSFCLGVLTMGAVLLMANKPASPLTAQPVLQPQPGTDNRRYQAVVSESSRTIIIDTQTGRFLLQRPTTLGTSGWQPLDFEQLHQRK